MSTVLVVGAGLAGLACARVLTIAGHAVTLVDKGRGPGGRLATRRIDEHGYDTGAQFFTVRDADFAAAVHGWQSAGLVVPWGEGFPLLDGDQAGDGHPRYRVVEGMNRLAKHLAEGLTVMVGHTVTDLAPHDGRWHVSVSPVAQATERILTADAVVLTPPAPQVVQLLQRSGLPVAPALAAVRYAPCLCLLLDFPQQEALLPAPGGVRIGDDQAIAWIASQRAKELRRTGEGLVVHATAACSAAWYGESEEWIVSELLSATRRVFGRLGISAEPETVQLKKWRYSLPTITVPEPCLHVSASPPLVLAGDAFGDRPRVEGAWLSGRAAARALA